MYRENIFPAGIIAMHKNMQTFCQTGDPALITLRAPRAGMMIHGALFLEVDNDTCLLEVRPPPVIRPLHESTVPLPNAWNSVYQSDSHRANARRRPDWIH